MNLLISLYIAIAIYPGTGKTMTVNAIAHELKKKVLLVDFGSMSGKKDGAGKSAALQYSNSIRRKRFGMLIY